MFRIVDAAELQRRMVNRAVARSTLTDLSPASPMMQVFGAVAVELEGAYLDIATLLEAFSIDGATGEDLDRRANEIIPDGLGRRGASRATGYLQWAVPTIAGVEIPIPVGTVARALDGQLYESTEAGKITVGSTQSQRSVGVGEIPALAVNPGLAGDAAVGDVSIIVTGLPTVVSVTNPEPFTSGRDGEKDDPFRQRIRAHIRSLSRCIPEALAERAKSALVGGRRITAARAWEDPINRGEVIVYVDDGAGTVSQTFNVAAGRFVDPVAKATGGESEFYLPSRPMRGNVILTHSTAAPLARVLVENVDYVLLRGRGFVWLHPDVFPTGLAAGEDLVWGGYVAYAGLVREAQRLIDGDPDDPINYPTWRAAGVNVGVTPATVRQFVIEGHVVSNDNANRAEAVAEAKRRVGDYANGLDVGAPFIRSEAIERAMGVPGMFNFILEQPAGDVAIAYNEVARVIGANLVIR